MRVWAGRHAQSMVWSLGRLSQAPLASLMTAAVLGAVLAFPAGLFTVLANVSALSERWDETTLQMSVFLHAGTSEADAVALKTSLSLRPQIAEVGVLSPADALREYRDLAGDEAALQAIGDSNPLPWVLLVELGRHDSVHAQGLVDELQQHPTIDSVAFDLHWLRRLFALMELGERVVVVTMVALALAMILVVGNTIRLEVERRRVEIEVLRLVGGTDAFIRRPFLYTGLWFGLVGGIICVVLLLVAFAALAGPVANLATVYSSDFVLQWPSAFHLLGLWLISSLLGFIGAWIALGRYLQTPERSLDL